MAGAATTLTKAVADEAGAVVYPHAVRTASFSATFNVALGGGTGGDGMAFALLNPGSSMSSRTRQSRPRKRSRDRRSAGRPPERVLRK